MTPDSREAQAVIEQVIQEIGRLQNDIRFAPAEGGSEYHEVRGNHFASFIKKRGEQIIALLADVLGSPRPEKEAFQAFADRLWHRWQAEKLTTGSDHKAYLQAVTNELRDMQPSKLTASAEVVSQPPAMPHVLTSIPTNNGYPPSQEFVLSKEHREVVSQPPPHPRDCAHRFVGRPDGPRACTRCGSSPDIALTLMGLDVISQSSQEERWPCCCTECGTDRQTYGGCPKCGSYNITLYPASAEGSIPSPTEREK